MAHNSWIQRMYIEFIQRLPFNRKRGAALLCVAPDQVSEGRKVVELCRERYRPVPRLNDSQGLCGQVDLSDCIPCPNPCAPCAVVADKLVGGYPYAPDGTTQQVMVNANSTCCANQCSQTGPHDDRGGCKRRSAQHPCSGGERHDAPKCRI